ncbi:substrate-binding domain-containing protein [Kamptonema sp. UHCC 0994]|uniref:PstS family phosphate ABC transporter substrate-binding protein n=1 Tax=Kamptonema sp. UHCC 0994 TaxID=3031329 RepID=UPI0023BA4525|nr:substrate-binding domain-containing protein [Kamptonema sp. UHCC 0994]MDF0556191.1 substrate-binding domain-containing protein [Kamptonema sp. UHCC 0994]
MMPNESNSVKCGNCGNLNPSTVDKCSYCGHRLRWGPVIVKALAGLVVLSGGYFSWTSCSQTLIPIPSPSPTYSLTSSPQVTTPSPIVSPDSNPTPTPSPPVPTTSPIVSPDSNPTPTPLPQLPNATTYRSLAEVPNVPKGVIRYGGSTTFAVLEDKDKGDAITAIKKAHPEFNLIYIEPPPGEKPGSGSGLRMLIEGQISIARSSRPLKDDEFERARNRNFTLEQIPVAIDGIAFYVNPELMNQGVKGITLTQAQNIFTGKVKNWKEIGGPDIEIAPFSRDPIDGGTPEFFQETVLRKQALGSNVQIARDTTESIRKVAINSGGIGYATASEVINQIMIRSLPLARSANSSFISPCSDNNCTAVNKATFTDGSYPITRQLFVIIKRDGSIAEQAGVAYADMLLSDEGQKLLDKAGFVPIRNNPR